MFWNNKYYWKYSRVSFWLQGGFFQSLETGEKRDDEDSVNV